MIDMSEAHIVKDVMIGNTRIRVAANYCEDKTPEDVHKILDTIAGKVQPGLVAKLMKEAPQLLKPAE